MPALVTVPLPPGLVVLAVAAVAVAVVLGDSTRTRRQAQAALRAEAAQRAVLAERARIAREMHDIVAHRLSLIALQAEAAPHQLAGLSPAAHATFDTLRRVAGEDLTEMRGLLGVLRDEDTSVSCVSGSRRPAARSVPAPPPKAGSRSSCSCPQEVGSDRVVVADDEPLARDGLAALIGSAPDIEVIPPHTTPLSRRSSPSRATPKIALKADAGSLRRS